VSREWKQAGYKTPLVVVDYLQATGLYAESPDEEKRLQLRERITQVVRQLRIISMKGSGMGEGWIGCPVLVLSTTARSNVRKGSNNPADNPLAGMDGRDPDELRFASLEELKALPKEAGEVEAYAVTCWALSLEKNPQTLGGGSRKLTLRLAKNRMNGPDGHWIPLRFYGATGRIVDEGERYRGAPTIKPPDLSTEEEED
jgi:hypothetical protein